MRTLFSLFLFSLLSICLLWPSMGSPDDHPIIISGSPSDAPFYFRDAKGEVAGLFVDFWKSWARKMDRQVRFETRPFAQVLEDVSQGRADIVAGFFRNSEHTRRFDYSQSYYEIPTHIFFRGNIAGVKGLNDLRGFTIGVVKGDFAEAYVQQQLPNTTLARFHQFDDLVKASVAGDVKVFICDTPVARFLLSKYGRADQFRRTAQPLYSRKIHAGVQKGHQDLLALVNLGFGRISAKERTNIVNGWPGVDTRPAFPWAMVGVLLAMVALCVAGLMLWNHQLRRRVAQATSDLKKQWTRLEESEKSLQRGNEALELKVHRRTRQMQRANHLLMEQVDQHASTQKRLSQNNAYLSALHETMLGLLRRLDLQELLEAIMKRVIAATGTQHGYVYLKDEKTGELEVRVGSGIFASAIGYRLKPGQGLAGKVLERGRYLLVEDYKHWKGRHPGSRWDGLGAVVGIPLTSGGNVVGVIGLCFMQSEGTFSPDEITFLNGFAELASIALDNARLYENLQNELAERERNELERKRLEERVQQAQKMEAIGTLAGGIAHDFNNILAVIMGNLEVAMEEIPPHSSVRPFLSEGFQSTIRARDLVQQILTFGRKDTLETKPIQIESVVAQGIKLIRASIPTSIEIRQQLTTGDALINANSVQIHQVLMNLSANAAHAMEETGGVLDIQLKKVVLNGDFCRRHPDVHPGHFIQLTIRDSGHGISPELVSRIFDPYFTTKAIERGTGLGLAVVHGIVKSYKGLILVESTPGQGTQFDIYLPQCNQTQADTPEAAVSRLRGTESILLVDDEAALAALTHKALQKQGYRVTICNDGHQAMDKFCQAPENFDIVITDMTMPRLNGDKLAEAILNRRPGTPIIMCTGFSHLISAEKAQRIGIRKLLMKPVFMGDLLNAIRDIFDHPG